MNKPSRVRDVLLRLLAGVLVGTLVAGVAYTVAFFTLRRIHPNSYPAMAVWRDLKLLAEMIETHKQKSGKLPTNLAELEGVKDVLKTNGAGQLVDRWDHPVEYRIEGESFTLLSYGRDGQPGGEGLDADFSPDRQPEPATLHQFAYEMSTGGVQASCILAGVCAGLVCLLPSRDHRRSSWAVQVLVTSLGALFVAFILCFVHSSGH